MYEIDTKNAARFLASGGFIQCVTVEDAQTLECVFSPTLSALPASVPVGTFDLYVGCQKNNSAALQWYSYRDIVAGFGIPWLPTIKQLSEFCVCDTITMQELDLTELYQ